MKRKNNKKGFTLAELLIVVAIIAVLVAVSIPIFTAQLEKSRESTDIANLRAAKAEAVAIYLSGDTDDTTVTWTTAGDPGAGFTAYYNADTGKLAAAKTGIVGYGKGTSTVGDSKNTKLNYAPGTGVKDQIIKVTVDSNGECTFAWEAA
jgi:type IV pilus assembly protein PilA